MMSNSNESRVVLVELSTPWVATSPPAMQLAEAREEIARAKRLFREVLRSGIVDCTCHGPCEGTCLWGLVEKASK